MARSKPSRTEAPTQLQVSADNSATDGTVVLDILVTPLTSASDLATGTIAISENGFNWPQAAITGSTRLKLKLPSGHHLLSVSYSGDSSFLGASKDLDLNVQGPAPARRRGVHH